MLSRRQILAAAALSPLLRAVPLADFKLGVTTDEIDEDLVAALRFLRLFDLKWAELRSVGGLYAEKQPLPKVKEMRAQGIFASLNFPTLPRFGAAEPVDSPRRSSFVPCFSLSSDGRLSSFEDAGSADG